MGNFAENTGNLLKSIFAGAQSNIGRGLEVMSGYLRTPQRDVTSDYLLSPVPDSTPAPTPTPPPAPKQQQFNRLTYYLPTGGLTATGTVPKSGYTAAISRQLLGDIPMGTLIQLPNGQIVRVEDVTDKEILDTLDIFYESPEAAKYPNGMLNNVPFSVVGRNTEGLKYNF